MFLKSQKIYLPYFGLEKPIKILQLTDLHLCFARMDDSEERRNFVADRRHELFLEAEYPERDPIEFLEEALEYSKDFDCTVITGDIVDSADPMNFEIAENFLKGKNYMFCPGEREFHIDGRERSFACREEFMPRVQSCFRRNLAFDSRILGGINVITMDNSFFVWTEEQFELLKKEFSRGLPILLFTHFPMNSAELNHNPSHPSLGVSEEVAEITRKVTEYIKAEPLIKATFCGHTHGEYYRNLGLKRLYAIDGLFKGAVGEIIVS